MPAPRLSDDTKATIVQMATGGISTGDIATELGISTWTVRKVLRDSGMPPKTEHGRSLISRLSNNDIEDIISRYNKGDKIGEICDLYKISHTGMYHILASSGIPPRKLSGEIVIADKSRYDQAIAMYQEGWVTWFITMETGIHQPMLHKEIHRRGIPLRGRGNWKRPVLKDGKYVRE